MAEVWVSNASPIIVLAKINRLEFLCAADHTLIIPKAVSDEILQRPLQDPARLALESGWGTQPIEVTDDPQVIEWGWGAGETALLSAALHKKAVALVDDW